MLLMKTMKYDEVVKRAKLNRSTAQYVLKSEKISGLPPTPGVKGRHRVFSPSQAVRLALATRLAMAGIKIDVVKKIVDYCYTQLKRYTVGKGAFPDERRFRRNRKWTLQIIDDEFVRLSGTDLDTWGDSECFSISQERMVEEWGYEEFIASHQVNLSFLEHLFKDVF